MNNAVRTLDEKRKIMGDRLKEMLQRANMSQSQLQNISKNKYDWPVSQPFINQICRGKRTLQVEDAKVFGKILNVDPGYLVGMDDFRAASYEDYPNQLEYNRNYHVALRAYNEYDLFLALMGYQVEGYSTVDDKPHTYSISRMDGSRTVSDIPANEMELFRSDVLQYMNKQFTALFEKHEFLPLYNFNEKEIDSLVERIQNGTLTQGDRNMILDTIKIGRESNNGK